MTEEDEEATWSRGHRAALVSMLGHVLSQLGYQDVETKKAAWLIEREETVAKLREVCADIGDNDWPDDLHLADVIDKHLARHVASDHDG